MNQQRGMALLLALWVLALASLLLGSLAVAVQLQQRQALWQRHHTEATLAAEAGVSLAVAGLMQNDGARWRADGEPHQRRFAEADLSIRVMSERGKLDLNAAPPGDIGKLLDACGATRAQRESITASLARRREQMPLRLLEEFRALPGVTFALDECAQPHITVWSGRAAPDPALAPPLLGQTLGLPHGADAPLQAGQVVTVTSTARLTGGFTSRLTVTLVMLNTLTAGAKPYRVLRWQE